MLCHYLVLILLHSPDACSSSSSCSDDMGMRVLAACAAPQSLQDWSLNTTLLSLFSFTLLLRLRPGSLSPRTSARLGLSYAKLNVLIIHMRSFYSKTLRGLVLQDDALDLRYERTASGAPSASLGHRAFSRCRNVTSSAVHESGATPSLTASRHLRSTPQISLCRPVHRFPPNAAFFEAIFW